MSNSLRSKRSKERVVSGLSPAELAYWAARERDGAPLCVIVVDCEAAEQFTSDWRSLTGEEAAVLPIEDTSPFALAAFDPDSAHKESQLRLQLYRRRPSTIVLTAAAAQGTWLPTAEWQAHVLSLAVGDEVARETILAHLLLCGYQAVNAVVDEGTFAVRGSVVDVFLPGADGGVRIELFGDEITSIGDIGRSPGAAAEQANERLLLAPIRSVLFTADGIERATEWLTLAREHAQTPTRQLRQWQQEIASHNYFYGIEAMWPAFCGEQAVESVLKSVLTDDAVLVLTDRERIEAVWRARTADSERARAKAIESKGPQVALESLVTAEQTLQDTVRAQPCWVHAPLVLSASGSERTGLGQGARIKDELNKRRREEPEQALSALSALWRRRLEQGDEVVLCAQHEGSALRLRELLAGALGDQVQVEATPKALLVHAEDRANQLQPAGTGARQRSGTRRPFVIAVAPMSSTVDDRSNGRLLLAEGDLFGTPRRPSARRGSKRRAAARDALNALDDLTAGDCVIHQDHGIGRYEGLVRLTLDGVDGDFVALTYADDDKLYVPIYRLTSLNRYHGLQSNARLDKLGSGRFDRAKRRVRDAVMAMAHAMLALEARRKAQGGFAFQAPGPTYRALAASFPFEETEDQQKAIVETLADLQKPQPMDRLICGDVGFGKTEVALRAAMHAVENGKQVAVLVPTTVLAAQHNETFTARLTPLGVECAALTRFTSLADRRAQLSRTASGHIDVLVGTHRLLTHELHFKDLGLLIIDEEQRFGVKHKERLKQLRAHVHVLTMSATPIPRTLHLATSGMRQLSVIATPPATRTAIKTEVLRADDDVLAEAIRREMARGGQSFIVFNRVQGIEEVAARVRALVPNAMVLLAHGQMPGHRLEEVMDEFVHRRAHVLVCTAIIESGIDIPSVNTMVVLDAHNFGLSQLYQLRGRIGRGTDRGYAYLMLPPELSIGKEVAERLNLLRRFSKLGAGLEVATHDLELRGAGDLLGSEQSGHIAAVGFELYTQLLQEAVQATRGGVTDETVEPELKVPVAALFPEQYMQEPIDRLTFYRRLSEAQDEATLFDILGEVAALFGPLPPEAEALAELMRLRRRLMRLGASSLSAAADRGALRVGVTFTPTSKVDRYALVERCQQEPTTYRLLPSGRLALELPLPAEQPADPDRGHDTPYILGADFLRAVAEGLRPLGLLEPVAP